MRHSALLILGLFAWGCGEDAVVASADTGGFFGTSDGPLFAPDNGVFVPFDFGIPSTCGAPPPSGLRVDLLPDPTLSFVEVSGYAAVRRPRLSPGGDRMAMMADRVERNRADLIVVPIEGGAPTIVAGDIASGGEHAWTPDGNALIYSDNSRILRQSLTSSAAEPDVIVQNGGFGLASIDVSADGSTLLWSTASNSAGVIAAPLDQLPIEGAFATFLAIGAIARFSPNGERISFSWFENSQLSARRIYAFMCADGSAFEQLRRQAVTDSGADWFDDDTLVLNTGGAVLLVDLNEDATKVIAGDTQAGELDFDPTSRRLVYVDGVQPRVDVWTF